MGGWVWVMEGVYRLEDDGTLGDGAVRAALHEPSHIPGHVGPPEAVS